MIDNEILELLSEHGFKSEEGEWLSVYFIVCYRIRMLLLDVQGGESVFMP
jgi:hypothetical protein